MTRSYEHTVIVHPVHMITLHYIIKLFIVAKVKNCKVHLMIPNCAKWLSTVSTPTSNLGHEFL